MQLRTTIYLRQSIRSVAETTSTFTAKQKAGGGIWTEILSRASQQIQERPLAG